MRRDVAFSRREPEDGEASSEGDPIIHCLPVAIFLSSYPELKWADHLRQGAAVF